MGKKYKVDVYLSYDIGDAPSVDLVADRMRDAGLRIVLPDFENPRNNRAALSNSRCLVVFISSHGIERSWPEIADATQVFRDPSDVERRFIPVRLNANVQFDPLRHFSYIDLSSDSPRQYEKLIASCLPSRYASEESSVTLVASDIVRLQGHGGGVHSVAMSQNGDKAVSGGADCSVRVWDLKEGTCKEILTGHSDHILAVALSPDALRAVSGSRDKTIRLWNLATGKLVTVFEDHFAPVTSVAMSTDGRYVVSGSEDRTLRIWDVQRETCIHVWKGHHDTVLSVCISVDAQLVVSGSADASIRLWRQNEQECEFILQGHTAAVNTVAISPDGSVIASGSDDRTVRIWDLRAKKCIATVEGHTGAILAVRFVQNGRYIVSGSSDQSVRVFETASGTCVGVSERQFFVVSDLSVSACGDAVICCGLYPSEIRAWRSPAPSTLMHRGALARYTNAKVLLVGDTGVGKSALAIQLTESRWEPATSSSDAVWATQLKIPVADESAGVEREIWLWDFAGQSDYRTIHQLFMDETALAIFVFNPQSEDPFSGLSKWDADIARAAQRGFTKILVAGRCDRGGLMVSRTGVQAFCEEKGFKHFIETSAQSGFGCGDLQMRVIEEIPWSDIPWTASPRKFKVLKEEIVKLRDEGAVLLRVSELKQQLQMRIAAETFTLDELHAVVGLLAGPGLIWRLEFGDFILLQPERANAYAAAIIRSVRGNTDEIGCISEEKILQGDLDFQDMQRLPADDEQVVLRAMHQAFVRKGLCVREHTEAGPVLVFPSYFKRERPEATDYPSKLVTYRFWGSVDEAYATLVVKLRSTHAFQHAENKLWRLAADFRTPEGKRIGVKVSRHPSGFAEFMIYADVDASDDAKVVFLKYVQDHLTAKDEALERERHYLCKECETFVENRKTVIERLRRGLSDIVCVNCENRVIINDLVEQRLGSPEIQERVRQLDEKARAAIDNESRELILVGHAYSVVGEAGQIFRTTSNSDWGIDGEVEFKDDRGAATGKRLYIQLKSGDSYLRERKRDGAEVFKIAKARHVDYWTQQNYPVMLVIQTSDRAIRWMNVSEYLKREREKTGKEPTEIRFQGEPFAPQSVLRWRDRYVVPKAKESLAL